MYLKILLYLKIVKHKYTIYFNNFRIVRNILKIACPIIRTFSYPNLCRSKRVRIFNPLLYGALLFRTLIFYLICMFFIMLECFCLIDFYLSIVHWIKSQVHLCQLCKDSLLAVLSLAIPIKLMFLERSQILGVNLLPDTNEAV